MRTLRFIGELILWICFPWLMLIVTLWRRYL